jgi:hypothetical protein
MIYRQFYYLSTCDAVLRWLILESFGCLSNDIDYV